MRNQFSHARYQYALELEAVEEAFLKEREEVLAANQDEINSLFSKRREMELDYMESKQKKQQEYMDEISKMRVRDSEECVVASVRPRPASLRIFMFLCVP